MAGWGLCEECWICGARGCDGFSKVKVFVLVVVRDWRWWEWRRWERRSCEWVADCDFLFMF
jgi:hypothetical protein